MTPRRHNHLSIDRLFEESSDPVYIIDPVRDRIVDANAAGCRVLEYGREELLATSISDIHPAELPQLQAFFDAALTDGANWTIALSCRTKSGMFLPTEITLYLLDTGHEVFVVGLLRDRSEHRGSPRPSELRDRSGSTEGPNSAGP